MNKQLTEKEQEVFLKLKGVIDPELMVNIIDLGLVHDVKIDNTNHLIKVEMTLTSPGCPMGEMIMQDVRQMVIINYPKYEVDVELVWNPPWSLDNLTEEGKKMLGR